jgi:hypothetical protein
MRKPKVDNKYNLTINKIEKMKYDREKIGLPIFWRNDAVGAWCILKNTIKSLEDDEYCTYNEFWLGIYDDVGTYAGKIEISVTSHGGMCKYNFNEFFNEADIENEMDLEIQELILKTINDLIDNNVLYIEK